MNSVLQCFCHPLSVQNSLNCTYEILQEKFVILSLSQQFAPTVDVTVDRRSGGWLAQWLWTALFKKFPIFTIQFSAISHRLIKSWWKCPKFLRIVNFQSLDPKIHFTIWDYLGLSWTIWEYLGISGTILVYIWLFGTIAKLSQSSSSSSIWAELALFSANPTTPTPTGLGKLFYQLQLTKYV